MAGQRKSRSYSKIKLSERKLSFRSRSGPTPPRADRNSGNDQQTLFRTEEYIQPIKKHFMKKRMNAVHEEISFAQTWVIR